MARPVLSILELSASLSQLDAYALIIPTETQAIAIALEDLKPTRPLTHDLFVNLSHIHNISLLGIEINKTKEDVLKKARIILYKKTNKTPYSNKKREFI